MDDKMSMTTIFKQFFLTILVVNYTKDKFKKYQLLNARVTQSNEKMVQTRGTLLDYWIANAV